MFSTSRRISNDPLLLIQVICLVFQLTSAGYPSNVVINDFYADKGKISCLDKPLPAGRYGIGYFYYGKHKDWSKDDFRNAIDLCSAHSTNKAHYQGFCQGIRTFPGLMEIVWHTYIADKWGLTSSIVANFCQESCSCPPPSDMAFISSLNQAIQRIGIDRVHLPDAGPSPLSTAFTCPASSMCQRYQCQQPPSRVPSLPRCVCKAKPTGKGRWAMLGCGAQAKKGFLGGKRSEQVVCPCNGTYVSTSCCDVDDGLVWEPPEMNLGTLDEDM